MPVCRKTKGMEITYWIVSLDTTRKNADFRMVHNIIKTERR